MGLLTVFASEAAEGMSSVITLSVFFEGTANPLDPITTQVGIFAQLTAGQDLSNYARDTSTGIDPTAGPFKIAFDGCGVTDGLSGVLFASGLDRQCDGVCKVVCDLLACASSRAQRLRINGLGLSRGGLALMILSQKIAKLPADSVARIDLNICLFDPVPGNLVHTGFPFTGWGCADLSACHCLRRVLALYPHEPLPDLSFHAPVLCKYPAHTEVEEDVLLGCHQGALFPPRRAPHNSYALASNLSFHRVLAFLTENGTDVDMTWCFSPTAADCLEIYRSELRRHITQQQEAAENVVVALRDAPSTRRALHEGCR